jgi:hypothetical protein
LAAGSTSSSARVEARAAALTAAALLGGCGGSAGAGAVIAHAQEGLARIHSGEIEVHAKAETPITLERNFKLPADEIPLARLELTHWTSHPRRIACADDLDCAQADLDIRAALRVLGPALPDLPVDADKIHDARLEAGIGERDRKPKFLRVKGKVDAGRFLGDVPFELELDLPPS